MEPVSVSTDGQMSQECVLRVHSGMPYILTCTQKLESYPESTLLSIYLLLGWIPAERADI